MHPINNLNMGFIVHIFKAQEIIINFLLLKFILKFFEFFDL